MNIFSDFNSRVTKIVQAFDLKDDSGALIDTSRITVEPPRDATHGDLACNAAMVLAKPAGQNPRGLAERIVAELVKDADVARADVAGPGFVNLKLTDDFWRRLLATMIAEGADFGRQTLGAGRKINVEYVSANPTGPMHVGHCRGAVVGDTLANISGFRRLRRDQGILYQRRRRADRCARPIGLSALPRGAWRRHRRHPGRPLSRRLSRAGRPGAGQGIRPKSAADAGRRVVGDRQGPHNRRHDGADPRRSGAAQCHATRCSSPSACCTPTKRRRSARRSML